MSPEVRWILACVRSLHRQTPPPRPVAPVDWEVVLAVAEAEGVGPALGFACNAGVPEAMPGAVRARLRRRLADSTAGHLVLLQELGRLLEGFRVGGVPVISLKGPVLGEMLYPRPALRPASDLDLLIRPEARLAVDDVLRELGYRRRPDEHSWAFDMAHDRATCYDSPCGVRVDLHWALLSEPRYVWNEAQSLEVWDRAIKIRVAGETVSVLCPEDLVVYLALHLAVHHGLAGLLWYWDLSLCIERWGATLDWQAVLARAMRWRVRAALYFALLELEACFGVSAPAGLMGQLRPRGPRAAAMRWVLRRDAQRRVRLEHLITLLLVDRARDLVRPLRRAACPAPNWVQARYVDAGSSLVGRYLAHYRRLGAVTRRATGGLRPHDTPARNHVPAQKSD
jgi:hypothetical protein